MTQAGLTILAPSFAKNDIAEKLDYFKLIDEFNWKEAYAWF